MLSDNSTPQPNLLTNWRYTFGIAWRNVRSQWVQSTITTLVVALATALLIAVMVLADGLQRGIVRASNPFGVLVVGAKGSAQQLVLNTLLLQGTPVGNIPIEVYENLSHDARVSLAVPLAVGHNVAGAPLIGTTPDFFTLRPSNSAPPTFQLQQAPKPPFPAKN